MTQSRELAALRNVRTLVFQAQQRCQRTNEADKLPGLAAALALIDYEIKGAELLQKLSS
jgi:hypothetical protein